MNQTTSNADSYIDRSCQTTSAGGGFGLFRRREPRLPIAERNLNLLTAADVQGTSS